MHLCVRGLRKGKEEEGEGVIYIDNNSDDERCARYVCVCVTDECM